MNSKNLDWLVRVYNNWLDHEQIEDKASAEALLMGYPLTQDQKNWIKKFIKIWKKLK